MKKIIGTEDNLYNEIFIRHIFGFDVFRVNKINQNMDLELKFLELVSQNGLMSAHTGSLHDVADSPTKIFGSPDEYIYYEEVNVGVFGGAFYSTQDWFLFPPCFFPEVNAGFWNLKNKSINSDLQEILSWDALAAYFSPRVNDHLEAMNSLFEMKFISSDDWIKKSLALYRLIILTAGDANFFKVYANSPDDFDILNNSLKKTEEIITSNRWYQENKNNLIWDDKKYKCLILRS